MEGWCVDTNPAYKIFIQDLISCFRKNDKEWEIKFGANTSRKPLTSFQIQAKVLQVVGDSKIMIVDDGTGKAKATREETVPGDFSWLRVGVTCSIVASLKDGGKLPHINIIKLTKVENPLQEQMWPLEVQELRNFLSKTILPILEDSPS